MSGRTKNVPGRRGAFSKQPFTCIITKSGATTALAKPWPATALPTAGVVDTEDYGVARFVFVGGSADALTTAYQVVGWYPVDTSTQSGGATYLPIQVAAGTVTFGSITCDAGGVGLTGRSQDVIADTITDNLNQAGTYVWSQASNDIAYLEVEVAGATLLEVETDITTATGMAVFAQLGELGTRHTDV